MTSVHDLFKQVSLFLKHDNDDLTDRYHYRYTIVGLAIFLLLITSKQYYGDPIQCYTTNVMFADASKFVHSICWMNGTYHMKEVNHTTQAKSVTYRQGEKITYYQWMILLVIVQCFLFNLPSTIWLFFTRLNGFALEHVSRDVIKNAYLDYYSNKTNWSKIQQVLQHVTDHLRVSTLEVKHEPSKNVSTMLASDTYKFNAEGKNPNEYNRLDMFQNKISKKRRGLRLKKLKAKNSFPLFWSYLFTKCLYLINVVLQFYLLSYVFNFNYFCFGYQAIFDHLMKRPFIDNEYFPKRSLCYVQTADYGKLEPAYFVCSLPLNLFNEIFYSVFWFWLCIIGVLTALSFSYWLLMAIPAYRIKYVKKAMSMQFDKEDQHSSMMSKYYFGANRATLNDENQFLIDHTGFPLKDNFDMFFNDVCSLDLVLIINLLAMNSNSLVASDLFYTLWYEYLNLEDVEKNVKELMSLDRRPLPTLNRTNSDYNKRKVNDEPDQSSQFNQDHQ
jgi:hypothetical protein